MRSALLLLPLLVSSCALLHPGSEDSQVIYALPPRQAGSSPLEQKMEPIAGPFTFSRERFVLTDSQAGTLAKTAPKWVQDKTRLLVAGFAQRDLPPDYARVLAHRRAESVRQALIEHGLDANNIHSVGYGNDLPSMGRDDTVLVYEIK